MIDRPSFAIRPYAADDKAAVLALSLRAWAPVFDGLATAAPDYVLRAFYPDGWRPRQTADIEAFLDTEGDAVALAVEDDAILGWVGFRIHPEDRMGEIYILAVDPAYQRRKIASALMAAACAAMRDVGMEVVMVETGADPGHAPSRATYESYGFERWPVARYFRPL